MKTTVLTPFNYAFQISRMIVFEVSFYRCGTNTKPYFATSASQFNQPKTDFNHCGQAQLELLKDSPVALNFFKKWDKLHLHNLSGTEYHNILNDILDLEEAYNYICNDINKGFSFYELKQFSKQDIKKPKQPIK